MTARPSLSASADTLAASESRVGVSNSKNSGRAIELAQRRKKIPAG